MRDDRGRRVTKQWNARDLSELRGLYRWAHTPVWCRLVLLSLPVTAIAALALLTLFLATPLAFAGLALAAYTLIVLLALLPLTNAVFIPRALEREGRCKACLYDLKGVEPDPDGFSVCPECSAAWRLSPEQKRAP